ncbi:MAG: BlaI/MecI/CopY family transcriptional regulator [Bacteroidales bacterium]|nr:BlaI/MecI/CopY family transcriptional regulator [Bacteroidales bacterium]
MEKLTFQEEEAMRFIWKTGPGFIKDYLEKYPVPQPPYTTLASIVKNLERKGFLTSKRYGNTYEYSPRVSEEEYKNKFLSGVVENYFENSYMDMVSFFAKKQNISAEELKDIIRMIEKNQG